MITTVCGQIARENWPAASAHEHFLIDLRPLVDPPADSARFYEPLRQDNRSLVYNDPYALLDNAVMDDYGAALSELKAFHAAGGRAAVDVTLDEIGRAPDKLKALSEESGVHIVMGCGHYLDGTIPARVREENVDALAAEMVRDLTVGAAGMDVKAGVIGEIGTGKTPTETETKMLTAAGLAGIETGAGIHVHTSLYERNGLWAAGLLTGLGVRPEKICIDHVDVKLRPDYIESLLDIGVYVEFDNFGKEFYISPRAGGLLTERFAYDLERARLIAALVKKGFGDRILLANDICLKSMLTAYGGQGYGHLFDTVRVMLGDEGVSDAQCDAMYRGNPAAFLDK